MTYTGKKVLIAMSGGVDSSVAAALMQEAGAECIGVTMKLYDNDDIGMEREKTCCSLNDIEDARAVARKLGIPYYVFNFKAAFREKVMDRFVDAYMRGETPNPCIECNRSLKFDALFRRAGELGCDMIVTGHYARISYNEATHRYELKKGLDEQKDQSYVLYGLTQEQLGHTAFPLGEYTKEECRAKALKLGLVNAGKHDSQDICFVPDGDYRRFIEEYTGKKMPAGDLVDSCGNVLGCHKGICGYTIGQRKGLGVALGKPAFVKEIRPDTNEVVLSTDESELFGDTLFAEDFSWISWDEEKVKAAGEAGLKCTAKVRYRHKAAPAAVSIAYTGTDRKSDVCVKSRVRVRFEEPQRAITRGQAVVLYDGDTVIGGGTIS